MAAARVHLNDQGIQPLLAVHDCIFGTQVQEEQHSPFCILGNVVDYLQACDRARCF